MFNHKLGLVSADNLTAARKRLAARRTAAAGQSLQERSTQMAKSMQTQDASAARVQERERINAILSHEKAEGCQAFALHLATKTTLSAEQAIECLICNEIDVRNNAKSAAQGATPFASYMDGSNHPNVGASGGDIGFHDEVIGSLVNMGLVSQASADRASSETVALAQRMGLKGFAKKD